MSSRIVKSTAELIALVSKVECVVVDGCLIGSDGWMRALMIDGWMRIYREPDTAISLGNRTLNGNRKGERTISSDEWARIKYSINPACLSHLSELNQRMGLVALWAENHSHRTPHMAVWFFFQGPNRQGHPSIGTRDENETLAFLIKCPRTIEPDVHREMHRGCLFS